MLVTLLLGRLGLNSRNSSKPPSTDPHRERKARGTGGRKPGGQPGHAGTTLRPVEDPDEVHVIAMDVTSLPPEDYRLVGHEVRQVVDVDITRFVTEWRAEIVEDSRGRRHVAPFPAGVDRPVQYGIGVKVHAVYMSQYQLLPYNRVEDHFREQLGIPVSNGSLGNFNQEAFDLLEGFEQWVQQRLSGSALMHVDETGINIGGKGHWLHTASNSRYTFLYPHAKRGSEATDAAGVLPYFRGILCHDHWKPYFKYGGVHALCNAHHLRELERAREQDGQQWAASMAVLLKEINKATHEAGGVLEIRVSEHYRKRYRGNCAGSGTGMSTSRRVTTNTSPGQDRPFQIA